MWLKCSPLRAPSPGCCWLPAVALAGWGWSASCRDVRAKSPPCKATSRPPTTRLSRPSSGKDQRRGHRYVTGELDAQATAAATQATPAWRSGPSRPPPGPTPSRGSNVKMLNFKEGLIALCLILLSGCSSAPPSPAPQIIRPPVQPRRSANCRQPARSITAIPGSADPD